MAAKRKARVPAAREGRPEADFWKRLLSATKVRRILERTGADPEAFRKAYLADASRGAGTRFRRPSDAEVAAVEAFLASGDLDALRRALGADTAKANVAIARVVKWKAARKGE
jgi:hypothetical protein